jgi:phospholipase/lecithinase/hemolysin
VTRALLASIALLPAVRAAAGLAQVPTIDPAIEAAPPVASALFVLGDSLSDVGNAASVADYALGLVGSDSRVGLCNVSEVLMFARRCDDLFYEQSRVGDGAVAVEYLAAHLRLPELEPSLHVLPSRSRTATNYAVASAKASGANAEDLAGQLDWLLLDHAPLQPDAVVVLMIGGNDAVDALQADAANPAIVPRPSAAIVAATVSAIGAAVERLLAFGARRLVVANVPDLAMLPAVRSAARFTRDETATLAAARAISSAFDERLNAELAGIEARARWLGPTQPTIVRFDLATAVGDAAETVASLGGNATDACFDSDAYRRSSAAERAFHAECAPTSGAPPRFAQFAFWDGIHPTGAAHAIIGAALVERTQRLFPSVTSVRSGRTSMLP